MPGKRLVWDEVGKHFYETGTDRGVLYRRGEDGSYNKGVPWNGLTGVTENRSGAEFTALWADNIKYLNLQSAEEFGLTIGAYTYPDEFAECNGSKSLDEGVTIDQQNRESFGFSYRTILGNDVKLNDNGYKIHLAYGLLASPSEMAYSTVNDSPEAVEMSWECQSTPVPVTGHRPTSVLTIDTTKISEKALKAIEDVLYGSETEEKEARLPLPDEVLQIIQEADAA